MRIEPATELWRCLERVRWLRIVARSGSLTGWNGIGVGSVVVESPRATVLTFAEAGSLQPPVGRETRFRNAFRWWWVYLFDLAPVTANSWCSVSPHLCMEDCYSAELQLHEWGLLQRWVIAGPRKQEHIEYEYLTTVPRP